MKSLWVTFQFGLTQTAWAKCTLHTNIHDLTKPRNETDFLSKIYGDGRKGWGYTNSRLMRNIWILVKKTGGHTEVVLILYYTKNEVVVAKTDGPNLGLLPINLAPPPSEPQCRKPIGGGEGVMQQLRKSGITAERSVPRPLPYMSPPFGVLYPLRGHIQGGSYEVSHTKHKGQNNSLGPSGGGVRYGRSQRRYGGHMQGGGIQSRGKRTGKCKIPQILFRAKKKKSHGPSLLFIGPYRLMFNQCFINNSSQLMAYIRFWGSPPNLAPWYCGVGPVGWEGQIGTIAKIISSEREVG